MGLAAVPKGSVSCPAGQCARCAPASCLGPAGGLGAGSPGTLGSPAALPHRGGLEVRGQPRGAVAHLFTPQQHPGVPGTLLGGGRAGTVPPQCWVLCPQPRSRKGEADVVVMRGFTGWAPAAPAPPRLVEAGHGVQGGPVKHFFGVGAMCGPSCSAAGVCAARCRARWSGLMFILIMSSQCTCKLIKSTH